MDLRSKRRLGSRLPLQQRGPSSLRGPCGAEPISFLSDDMILLILVRLNCVRTAVRTGLLSRRWRGLWTCLRDLVFRGVGPDMIEAALSRFSASSPAGTAFNLDICLPSRPEAADANSLLRAAALFSTTRLIFTIEPYFFDPRQHTINLIQLPCFQHATSIELDTQQFTVEPPVAGEFPALERLSISGTFVHMGALVTRCPRLRVLRAKLRGHGYELLKRELGSLKDALATREVAVSIDMIDCVNEAVDLSPLELVYTNTACHSRDLACFHRATSIERLRLCNIHNLGEFVSCCPRLRVLTVDGTTSGRDITVHSSSLQELVLGTYKDCRGINIVAPQLKQLTMEVHAGGELYTSVLAPLVEKVSWRRWYTWPANVFGFWLLQSLSLETATSIGERILTDDGEDDAWLSVQQLPRAHVLSMAMCASAPSLANLDFSREIEKLSVTEFSVVGIRLAAMGHVYGATLFHLLQVLPFQSVTKILKINLVRPEISEVTQACIENCFCEEPKNWRSQSISLPHLEEVEIKGFTGEDHAFDFLKLICRCAPKLKKVTIKLEKRFKSFGPVGCAKKIYSISLVYPSVDFYVYLSCGSLVPHP